MKKRTIFLLAAVMMVFAACKDNNEPSVTNITNNYGTNSGEISCSVDHANVLAKGSSFTIKISSKSAWSASSDKSWISISPSSGQGDTYVTITSYAGDEGIANVLFTNGSNSAPLVINRLKPGLLPGKFAVSATDTIHFSQGNLQYRATVDTWQFAGEQYEIIGDGNKNISPTYSGWIDLFGWGTGDAPTKASTDYSDYAAYAEWGDNPISNGGNKANMWRTLTKDEWVYLLHGRSNAEILFGLGTIDGINGAIMLPDNWVLPAGVSFTASTTKGMSWQGTSYYNANFDSFLDNTYSSEEWEVMEAAGAVFLPGADQRIGTSMYYTWCGYYWSATSIDGVEAYSLVCSDGYFAPTNNSSQYNGLSVRLVQDVK